jgi:hypothetical protein
MPRPILETLHHLEGGVFLNDAADGLSEIVKAVDATGKPGKITLEITVRKAMSSALAIKGKVTVKLPPETPLEALMFPTPEGNLLTEDPRQGKLPLAPVSGATDLPIAGAKAA